MLFWKVIVCFWLVLSSMVVYLCVSVDVYTATFLFHAYAFFLWCWMMLFSEFYAFFYASSWLWPSYSLKSTHHFVWRSRCSRNNSVFLPATLD